MVAQPTRYRPLPSAVRAYLAARVNQKTTATNYLVVDHYQIMEQQLNIISHPNKLPATPLSVSEGHNARRFDVILDLSN